MQNKFLLPFTSIKNLSFKKIAEKLSFNWRLSMLLPYFIFSILFIVLPAILLIKNVTSEYHGSNSVGGFMKTYHFWDSMGESVWMGLLAAFISLLLIYPFVWMVSRLKNKSSKTIFLTLMLSPLVVFTIAKIFALKGLLISMFDDSNFNNVAVREIGMVYLYSPFMVVPLYSVISTMPKSLMEASSDLGYGTIKTMFKVVLPYSMKGICAGLALVFMLSSTNLVISNSLLNGSSQTKPLQPANIIDAFAQKISNPSPIYKITASSMSLITIAIMASIYAGITFIPQIVRKVKGGVNV